jgi:hypothetical protein
VSSSVNTLVGSVASMGETEDPMAADGCLLTPGVVGGSSLLCEPVVLRRASYHFAASWGVCALKEYSWAIDSLLPKLLPETSFPFTWQALAEYEKCVEGYRLPGISVRPMHLSYSRAGRERSRGQGPLRNHRRCETRACTWQE